MKHCALVLAIVAATVLLFVLIVPALMRSPSPEEFVPTVAEMRLRNFHVDYNHYRLEHGGDAPESVDELVAAGHYLNGIIDEHRKRILVQLEYPVLTTHESGSPTNALAAYRVRGFGDFYLMRDGSIRELRLPDYSERKFRRAQKEQWREIERQSGGRE